jgi:hypothetical protein
VSCAPETHFVSNSVYLLQKQQGKKKGQDLFSEFQYATTSTTSPNYIKMDTWSFKNDTTSTDFTQQVTGMITNKYLSTVV